MAKSRPARREPDPTREQRAETRFEAARSLWADLDHSTPPPFDLNAAKERLLELDSKATPLSESLRDIHREQGDLLRRIKKVVGHGKFLPWIKENVAWSDRKVRDLMKHAR